MKIVKFLVENGADVHATNWFGDTARDIAEKNRHWKVVDYLEVAGNKTDSKCKIKQPSNLFQWFTPMLLKHYIFNSIYL